MDHQFLLELPQFLPFLQSESTPSLQSTTNSQLSDPPQLPQFQWLLLQLPTTMALFTTDMLPSQLLSTPSQSTSQPMFNPPLFQSSPLLLSHLLFPTSLLTSGQLLFQSSQFQLSPQLFLTNQPTPGLQSSLLPFQSSPFQFNPLLITVLTTAPSDPLFPTPSQPKCTTLLVTLNSCLQFPSNDDFYRG